MRQIKFRAWDKTKKKMFVPNHIDGYGTLVVDERHDNGDGTFGTHPIEYPNPYVLMQFTGLHDKNGKEIYEGDIIEWDLDNQGNKDRMAMRFEDDQGIDIHAFSGMVRTAPYINSSSEIIGNIYENPELLGVSPTNTQNTTKDY